MKNILLLAAIALATTFIACNSGDRDDSATSTDQAPPATTDQAPTASVSDSTVAN